MSHKEKCKQCFHKCQCKEELHSDEYGICTCEECECKKPFSNKEFWKVLNICIEKLPEKMREVFVMREIDELSTEEICKVLDLSSSNVWVILHRTRNRLRALLEEKWFSDEKNQEG